MTCMWQEAFLRRFCEVPWGTLPSVASSNLSSTSPLCSTPCAHNHVNHSSSNDIIFIPLKATVPLSWFITCAHWHVSFWIVLWFMSLDEWYASHCTACNTLPVHDMHTHVFVATLIRKWIMRSVLMCSVHPFLSCNSERITLKGMLHNA